MFVKPLKKLGYSLLLSASFLGLEPGKAMHEPFEQSNSTKKKTPSLAPGKMRKIEHDVPSFVIPSLVPKAEDATHVQLLGTSSEALDQKNQLNVITFLKANELLNVRATSKSLNALVVELIATQILSDLNSFKSKSQRPPLGLDDQRALNNFLENIPALQQVLSSKLDTEGAFLVHKDFAARSMLMRPKTREAFQLTSKTLTAVLEQREALYKTVYAQVFGTDFLNLGTAEELRNQSILQHLSSSFTFFERTNQNNNQDNALFFKRSTAKLGDMLKSLKAQRSYVAFEEAQKNSNSVTDESYVLMSDAELTTAANKAALGDLLEMAPGANLILDAGQAFVNRAGVYFLSDAHLPETLKRLTLTNASRNVTTIGDRFLKSAKSLESIDLLSLGKVTTIGNRFLQSTSLKSIDLSSLGKVTTIGDRFLQSTSLKSIDLSALENVTTIGDRFLYHAKSLESIDLSALDNVTTIGNGFLSYAISLKSIDLSSLGKVTTIGDRFLQSAKSLESIDLSALDNVTTIGEHFLQSISLKSIDLSSLGKVTTIGDRFLYHAKSLESIDLSGLDNVTTIGVDFLFGAEILENIDLSGLDNVTTIGDYFLGNAISLKSIDLSALRNVRTIGYGFLESSLSLKSIDLSALGNVTTIGHEFLGNAKSLESIDLSGLDNVTTIGDHFLAYAVSLKSIDLSALRNVRTIGGEFLRNAISLKSIDLSALENVTTIGDRFLF